LQTFGPFLFFNKQTRVKKVEPCNEHETVSAAHVQPKGTASNVMIGIIEHQKHKQTAARAMPVL
jgi:dihydroorotase